VTQPRVVHVVPALFGQDGIFGGAERYALELARYMAEQTPTRLVTFSDKPAHKSVGQLDVRVLAPAWRIRGQPSNSFHSGLIRHLAWSNVVHCHQRAIVASSFSAAFCRATGRRVFVSDLGGGGWDISAYVSTDKWFHAHLHISEYSRSLAGRSGWDRTDVILGGVDTDRFSPDPAVPKEPLVVFVGRLMPHKGVNDLIEALPDGLTLELIGRPYHDRFLADLKRLAVGKSILFRPDCDDDDLVRAYRRAICVVLPSVYRTMYGDESLVPELLGQTLLEGMACGTPTLCTDVASLPEVVVHEQTGFVIPPNDPVALRVRLEWLRDHPDDVRRLGQAGRDRVLQTFTWPTVVRHCLDVYERKSLTDGAKR
jgi:glycosyltransferase involved in cell wall biosynthesis